MTGIPRQEIVRRLVRGRYAGAGDVGMTGIPRQEIVRRLRAQSATGTPVQEMLA